MRIVKWFCFCIIALLLIGWLFIYLVASGINETTVYTENDFFKFHTLTDGDIEKAPRITTSYYFESHPGDGYAPSNAIIYNNASDLVALRNYLRGLGYQKEIRKLGDNEIWSKPDKPNGSLFYLSYDSIAGTVTLTKIAGR